MKNVLIAIGVIVIMLAIVLGVWWHDNRDEFTVELPNYTTVGKAERPLIFMNSCTSGGAVPLYTDMAGWANSFLGAGCGAFIGALREIRDTGARIFAKRFYDEVTGGKNLGESTRAARSALKSSDPTHLAYTRYGSPLATMS
jgi:hypothetical protein